MDVQVNLLASKSNGRSEQMTQTTYSDKINYDLSANILTQTFT